jgi:hypothetical protein
MTRRLSLSIEHDEHAGRGERAKQWAVGVQRRRTHARTRSPHPRHATSCAGPAWLRTHTRLASTSANNQQPTTARPRTLFAPLTAFGAAAFRSLTHQVKSPASDVRYGTPTADSVAPSCSYLRHTRHGHTRHSQTRVGVTCRCHV